VMLLHSGATWCFSAMAHIYIAIADLAHTAMVLCHILNHSLLHALRYKHPQR